MTDKPNQTGPTHRWVADRIGYSLPGVSLLRTGKRKPNLKTMELMEEVFEWPMCDQVDARDNYHAELNRMLADRHNQETKEN